LALACAVRGQQGVVADHEPFVGKRWILDLGEVALIEQRQLKRASLDERRDIGGAQRGDPVDVVWHQVFANAS
jgi:hypothetical protein